MGFKLLRIFSSSRDENSNEEFGDDSLDASSTDFFKDEKELGWFFMDIPKSDHSKEDGEKHEEVSQAQSDQEAQAQELMTRNGFVGYNRFWRYTANNFPQKFDN